jgi:hypothetical protein
LVVNQEQQRLFNDFKDLFDATVSKLNEKIEDSQINVGKRVDFLNSKLKENILEVQQMQNKVILEKTCQIEDIIKHIKI